MKSAPRLLSHLARFVAIGMVLAALTLTFRARGHPQVAQQPYPPPQTPTPGPYPPPATPIPTFTPLPTQTPGGPPTPPPPPPRPTDIVLPTPIPPEVTDALTQPIQITTRPAPRSLLDVDGNYVVWRSYENGQTNVVAYNLVTGEERRISSLPGGKNGLTVSGRYVVWVESLSVGTRHVTVLRAYDLSVQQEIQIGFDEHTRDYPDISDHIVVWSDWRHWTGIKHGQVDIYGYDLRRGEEFPVAVGPGSRLFPRISGNWVIYLYSPPEAYLGSRPPYQRTLRAHHLRTGEDIELGSVYTPHDASCCWLHTISGHRVVWADGRRVHLYDLATHQEHVLPEPQRIGPSIELLGNLLRAGGRLYNVETGAKVEFFQPFRPERPTRVDEIATDGQTVAWIFDAGGEGRVYVARLQRLP